MSINYNFKNNGAQTWSKYFSCVKASIEYARAMIFPWLLIDTSGNAASERGPSIFSRQVAPLRHITCVVYETTPLLFTWITAKLSYDNVIDFSSCYLRKNIAVSMEATAIF